MVNIVDKHSKREYTALTTNNGVVLCDKDDGAFLVLRHKEDIDNLKRLLDKIEIID